MKKNYRLIRFSDDFIIMGKNPEEAKKALLLSKKILEDLFLKLDEEEITSFEHGFKFLGVIFVRSLIMVPFDKPKKKQRVLFYPPPLDMDAYLLKKKSS
ncbi:MAG: hypothetical protein ACMUJM_22320 [bacterium]